MTPLRPKESKAECILLWETRDMYLPWLDRFLCWLGLHEFRVVSKSFEFRTDEAVETVECRRCGMRMTRKGQSGFIQRNLSKAYGLRQLDDPGILQSVPRNHQFSAHLCGVDRSL